MIDQLNREAFELVNLVVFKPKEISKNPSKLEGSSKEKGFVDLTDKLVGPMIERTEDYRGNTIEIFKNEVNGSLGFEKATYLRFKILIHNLFSIEHLNQKVSIKFIEEESLNWIIEVYKTQRAKNNLYDHILLSADTEVKSYAFYFPVLNLEIEETFKIGNTEFTYFKKEYIDNLCKSQNQIDGKDAENYFQQLLKKDFQGQVLAKVTITAEKEKAEAIAKKEAEISVNVLKLYSDSVFEPEINMMFDLNYKLGYQVQSNFLLEKPNETENLVLNIKNNVRPFTFTKIRYQSAIDSGLKIFSNYISHKNKDELHEIILQSIHFFGSAISNWDLHIRCVNLITILESIFLEPNESNSMEHKTKARLSKVLTNNHQKKQKLKTVFSNIYQVRHKMIHKAIRVEIIIKELAEAQMVMVNLFYRLIELNTKFGFKDKKTLINELNQIKS